MNTAHFQFIEGVTEVRRTARGLELALAPLRERLQIDAIRDDIVRLRISRQGRFDDQPTFAVCAEFPEPPPFTIEEENDLVRLRTSALTVTVHKRPFGLEVTRVDGTVILREFVGDDGASAFHGTLNDEWVTRRACDPGDAFFGLGEKTGSFNRRGRTFTLWNSDVLAPAVSGGYREGTDGADPRDPTSTEFDPYYISIPFFYHRPAGSCNLAGFFFDNGYRSHCDFAGAEHYGIHFTGGQYTEYIMAGPSMRDILVGYTWLTGRMKLPPLWALGHHQSRWFAYSQEKVEELGQTFRTRNIPCDTLWLDIDHMDGYRVFTWDPDRFPTPEKMLARLGEQGFGVVTIIDPGVKEEEGYAVFDEALRRDLLCRTEGGAVYIGQVWPGRTAFPDFLLPETRAWWGELNAAHVRSGLAGIWNDMNEPATGDVPDHAMRFGRGRFSHEQYHNQYALLMAMGTVEGLQKARPDQRFFVLSRAGSPGLQRYAANWMGDNVSRWDHLRLSIPMALGLGVSGQPFVGADIGGFMGDTTAELLVRWYQSGVLTPFCRNHNCAGRADQYPWAFGEETERLCREAIELRYRLLPYLYASFVRATETGEPVQKPLLFDYQTDPATHGIDDQYLLGDHLLVAPICESEAREREVYLPAGTWHQWHTGERINGGRTVRAAAPLEFIPLYARGGAIIPLWPGAPPSTRDFHPTEIELHLFVPEEEGATRSLLQEDDGVTFAADRGAFYRTEFLLERKGNRLSLSATVTGKGYPEFRRERFRLCWHGAACRGLTLDGAALELAEGSAWLENDGRDFRLEAEVIS